MRWRLPALDDQRRGSLGDLRTTLLDLKRAGYYLSDTVIESACAAAQRNG